MPKLVHLGKIISTYPTRAQCIVDAFERGYVVKHRGRNVYIPGVEIRGKDGDDEGVNPYEQETT